MKRIYFTVLVYLGCYSFANALEYGDHGGS
ncbi:MAG: hypothetical protein JWQ34_1270 [Mucilaginibacter sp.]|nr:hypothetical protein [Mucilaginibacter sp.]